MLCPSCNRRNRDTASYCRECGTGLTTPCSKCGKEIPAGAWFCDFCGHPAPGDAGSTASQGPVRRTPTGKETSDTLEFLSNLSMFQYLDREVLESLADQMRLVSLPEGPIFKENEPVDGLYMIKSGVAKVTKSADVGAPGGGAGNPSPRRKFRRDRPYRRPASLCRRDRHATHGVLYSGPRGVLRGPGATSRDGSKHAQGPRHHGAKRRPMGRPDDLREAPPSMAATLRTSASTLTTSHGLGAPAVRAFPSPLPLSPQQLLMSHRPGEAASIVTTAP